MTAGTPFAVALAFLILFFVQGVFFIRANSQTFDEAAHLGAGYSYFTTGEFRLNSEHPPLIKQFQALPVLLVYRIPFDPNPRDWQDNKSFTIGHDFLYKSAVSADRILALARAMNSSTT